MGFSNLPSTLQNVYLTDFNQYGKVILILSFLFVAYFYVKNFKPRENSIYKGVRFLRGLYYVIALVFLSLAPYYVVFLAPAVPFDDLLRIALVFLSINLGIIAPIVLWNMTYYGIAFFTDLVLTDNKFEPMRKEAERILGKPEDLL